jgi:hypothetical protein
MTIDARAPRFGAAITTLVLTLAAAFLNAASDLCLGCHTYLLIQRIQPAA